MLAQQAANILPLFEANDLSFIPLVTPTTTPQRMATLASVASSFIYCVSVSGVTGARSTVSGTLSIELLTIHAMRLYLCKAYRML
jgi:tryptophan synthase alpha subunit